MSAKQGGLSLGSGRSVSIITDREADLISVIFDIEGESYQWVGKASKRHEIMREIGRDAANVQLSITWDDAAWIKQVLRDHFPGETIATKFVSIGLGIKKMLRAMFANGVKP
jgi:hypothetical protein